MDRKEHRLLRLGILGGFLVVVLILYLGVLYDTQVNDYNKYLAQSIRSIAREEKVEASRGIITDRSGRPMVSNRSTYSLTFDASLLQKGDDENEAILRLIRLCQAQGVAWVDNLPITAIQPFAYTVDQLSSIQKGRFMTYVKSLPDAREALGKYFLSHPEATGSAETAESILAQTELDQDAKAAALVDCLTADAFSAQLLEDAGVTVSKLLGMMRAKLEIPSYFTLEEARLVLGVQYELSLRKLDNYDVYILAEDIDTVFISLLSDGDYAGAKVSRSTVREYETEFAAHILGTVGRLQAEDWDDLKGKGYDMDDWIGRDGVELAFEEYLKGTDGRRVVSTNAEGKITGEYYSEEPEPGNTVELTIDLELQQAVETYLAQTVSAMSEEDGDYTRGAGVVVEKVGTGEILALASYPTFNLSTYRQDFTDLSNEELNPDRPLYNRATQGRYAPGSTLKPLTAVAALEEGVTTLTERLRDTGFWRYPGDPSGLGTYCWNRSGHGWVNVTSAITNSCNYFFAEMGYRMGMDTLREYLSAFGLGSSTGIEIGDSAGLLPENPQGQDQAPWAAYGQSNQLYTPIQMANYISTLVSGGKRCEAHLLKAVKSYDSAQVLAVGNTDPVDTIAIRDSTLQAVKEGMLGYTQPGGQLHSYFTQCVVTAGAKTGTAQLGGGQTNNGVFVCFAPYDDPEIVVSIVIEHGNAGAALASTAVSILNAYFAADDVGTAVIGENQLLP